MPSLTLADIRSEVKTESDLNEELFIDDTQIDKFINRSIRDAEALIHGVSEDYFLSNANIALVSGTSTYDFPSDIYADKIKLIQYDNGSTKYLIRRIRTLDFISNIYNNQYYSYLITNTSAAGRKIRLYPAAYETSSSNVTIWYLRNAKELALDTDVCDIPEFISYIYARTKGYIQEFEGSPMIQETALEIARLEKEMVGTLANRFPDDDNKIIMDESFYDDFNNC